MCTLSVITGDNGYLLAMNRDERLARGAGERAEIHELRGARAIYPSERAGGTWTAVNKYGVALGLLNWNHAVRRPKAAGQVRSRGQIIADLGGTRGMGELQTTLTPSAVERVLPFRLVGVFPSERAIGEWRWDTARLEFQDHSWHSRHWFSSSLSDDDAEHWRGMACRNAEQEVDAGSAAWLRRLHASHVGGAGPFSLCVHRESVATLSYTEVVVTPEIVQMSHFRGSPCGMGQIHPLEIQRAESPELCPRGINYADI